MCGIAGIFSSDLDKKASVRMMVSALIHRGPDSDGYWGNSFYEGGMRRLSILDIEGGKQPLFDESGQIVLFYNGEIYNSPELRKSLEKDGFIFKTNSDGEVICHMYRKYGKNLFSKLDGMFAVALWDNHLQNLILARDFPGEKPLYYSELDGGGIAFSSELNSLLKCSNVSRELNYQAIWDFPSFLWVPEPETIYKKIKAIPPGEGLIISQKSKSSFSFKENICVPSYSYNDNAELILNVKDVVTKAIKSRLLSDVPMGAFLSGGLDSSIVSMIAKSQLNQLHTYCIGFEKALDPYHGLADESSMAEEFASWLGTKHHNIVVTANDFKDLLPKFIKSAGQPYAVSSGLGILAVSQYAHNDGVKVLLSGDGADEAFGGYSWYANLPKISNNTNTRDDYQRYYDLDHMGDKGLELLETYPRSVQAWALHYYASEKEKHSLFSSDFKAKSSLRFFDTLSNKSPYDFIKHDRAFYFPNEMLSKLDRMTMAFSVEGRAPFAAPMIQMFVSQLPYNSLVKKNILKWALREAFKNDMPSNVLKRPKHGFNVPIDFWLKGEWSDMVEETFSNNSYLVKRGLLNKNARKYALEILNDKKKITGHVIFCFVMLNLWMAQNEY